ncbi:omega-hydroxypalmitate O-feruloyl transferase [Benincasa hispida]|uniref:omega-hydroxypalmitate O-feruloyl transferase n=1 Tax=Benincasa hispida TaxID=102211 RepID=UPI001900F86D|nr:omega-hydroxypalmitate O-feruloyl transferase [Benincasa hispida]
MGSFNQEAAPLLPQDLKVSIKECSVVFPSQLEAQKESTLFLTNIDQVLDFNVETVHFFAPHAKFPPHVVIEKIKSTFSNLLVPYHFLAGRLKVNRENGRFEIDCNGVGAGFVVASSDYSLDEIGDMVYPNPAFHHLVTKSLDALFKPDDQPLVILQVTLFKCGGFAMGFSTNHCTLDGLSFKLFLDNFAALADNKPLAVTPCHDRHLLAARSPPRVTFPHHELLKLDSPLPSPDSSNASVFEATPQDLDFKIFKLTATDIATLKQKAQPITTGGSDDGHGGKKFRITGFNVVTALVWRCKALSLDAEDNHERPSTLLYAVDIRSRMDPPLPTSYCGNAVLTVYATAKCKELEDGPFSRVVEMVSEAAARMTDEYARSAIDWGELYKGFPNGEFLVSSWWRLGFAEVEYPWGKPRYSCPVVCHRKDIILLFPDMNESGKTNNGVNVLVALPKKQMEKFHTLFKEFMA